MISDNASTDGTADICQKYVELDNRVRYYRNNVNLGAAMNANRTFELSKGKYFKLAAHDDTIAPNYLERCVEALERDTSVVLCHSRVRFIDERGEILTNYDVSLENTASVLPHKRFADLILVDHWCLEIFGLIRSSSLAKTPLFGGYVASDRVLLAELALLGRFYELPEYLFFSRQHQEQSIRALYVNFRGTWFDSSKTGIAFPHWRIFVEYVKCLGRVPLSATERIACYYSMLRWFGVNVHWARLLVDVILAIYPGAVHFIRKFENAYYNYRNNKAGRSAQMPVEVESSKLVRKENYVEEKA